MQQNLGEGPQTSQLFQVSEHCFDGLKGKSKPIGLCVIELMMETLKRTYSGELKLPFCVLQDHTVFTCHEEAYRKAIHFFVLCNWLMLPASGHYMRYLGQLTSLGNDIHKDKSKYTYLKELVNMREENRA